MIRLTVVGGDAALPLTKEGICRNTLPRSRTAEVMTIASINLALVTHFFC